MSSLLEQQPSSSQIIRVDEQPDGSLIVEPPDDDALFDEFLGRVNDISEQTGATDFEDVIPILQREIPGLRVYELAEEEEGEVDVDDEPSLEDFRDVEDYAKAVSDLMETEHEENQQQAQRAGGRLEKRGEQNDLIFDYPRDDDDDDDTFDTDYAEILYDDDDHEDGDMT